MLKQTLVWTALPHRAQGPAAPGATLRLSVLLSPRLWNDDTTVESMPLGGFPDFLDLPSTMQGAAFQVRFDGGLTLPATVASAARLDSALWKSLFGAETRVVPFRFEDLTGSLVLSVSSTDLHGLIEDVYVRTFALGEDLPSNAVLIADPGLSSIARPVRPRDELVLTVPTKPVDLGGRMEPVEPHEPARGCMGCLLLPLRLLMRLLRFLLRLLGISSHNPAPAPTPPPGSGGSGAGGAGGGGSSPAPAGPGGPVSPDGTSEPGAPGGPGGSGGSAGPGGSGGPGAAPSAPADPRAAAFGQLAKVLAPTAETEAPLPDTAAMEAEYDFHAMVAALGDYPELMRLAGLVVDLEVTLGGEIPAAAGTVRVIPTLALQSSTAHFTPDTHYLLDGGLFTARPRPVAPETSRGLLRLDDAARFAVHQVDVAGAATKLANAATSLAAERDLKDRPPNSPAESGLPALQTAGISVVRRGTDEALREQFLRSWALNAALADVDGSPSPPPAGGQPAPPPDRAYFAEDLVRGYRVDVWDDRSKDWHSLCQRVGRYRLLEPASGAAPELTLADEGFIQISVTEPLVQKTLRELRTHESLFTWDGWSLCAPRPGLVILPGAESKPGQAPADERGPTVNPARTPFRMETAFTVPKGTLPRLRIGWSYRLRARVADLAGNSAFGPGDAEFGATQPEVVGPTRFGRFEPVAPPTMVLRESPKEGESLERLTVRSAPFDAAAAIEAQTTERHLAPPSASQRMVELHGRLDGPTTMRKDAAGYALAAREAASPTHGLSGASDERVPLAGVEAVKGASAGADDQAVYWVQKKDRLEVVYLPDPPAAGVALIGLPGDTGVRHVPYGGAWPDLEPLRLRVRGIAAGQAPAAPDWDPAARVLTVQLSQGETARVRFGSYLAAGDEEQMALMQWVNDAVPPAAAADLAALVQKGRNWLLLPYRELVLVHAVRQPLELPTVSALARSPERALGDTSVLLDGSLDVDGKSTGKVDLWAEWSDPRDDPSDPANAPAADRVPRRMHVRELILPDPAEDKPVFAGILAAMDDKAGVRHALGDTRFHRVRYGVVGTSRFREHFPPGTPAESLVRPLPAEQAAADAAAFELPVPSTARPDAPRPLYAVPTFRWTEPVVKKLARVRVRGCGGVRVYLERPWWSSGDGELLGVLLRPAGVGVDTPDAELLKKYTSEWGMDPLWAGAETAPLEPGDFDAKMESGLSLEELPGTVVDVVAVAPGYDAGRGLWYADVPLLPNGAYFPFARLALARFQPNSVPGAHLSRVVLSDFVQVVPERTAAYQVVPQVGPQSRVYVSLTGPATADVQDGATRRVVLARVERRRLGDTLHDAVGWKAFHTFVLTSNDTSTLVQEWTGEIALSHPLPEPLRVVLLELELYQTDSRHDADPMQLLESLLQDAPDPDPDAVPNLFGSATVLLAERFGYRVVFADAAVFD
jgi:hypothetical protein